MADLHLAQQVKSLQQQHAEKTKKLKQESLQLDQLALTKHAEYQANRTTIQQEVEQAKNEYVQFSLAYEAKQNELLDAEALQLKIKKVPDPHFRAKIDTLPDDLSDVSPGEVASHLGLSTDADLFPLQKQTMHYLLRKLFMAELSRHLDFIALWNGKDEDWKAVYGTNPKVLLRHASRTVLIERLTTYLRLPEETDD